MELEGKWSKDEEGFMEFENYQLQRLYEAITDQYHQVYNRYLDEFDDEELASLEARKEGYEIVTDYKTIHGEQEFATTYKTPTYLMDMWYEFDADRKKRIYHRGFMMITDRK